MGGPWKPFWHPSCITHGEWLISRGQPLANNYGSQELNASFFLPIVTEVLDAFTKASHKKMKQPGMYGWQTQ